MSARTNTILIFLVLSAWTIAGVAACSHYTEPALKPDASAVRVVGKIVAGAAPVFEPGEDPAKDYFVVTPAFVLYLQWLAQENREQALTIERLRAIIEGKK